MMRVKEESKKSDLKLNIQKTKIMSSGPITLWQIDGENIEAVIDFSFLCSKITVDGDSRYKSWTVRKVERQRNDAFEM